MSTSDRSGADDGRRTSPGGTGEPKASGARGGSKAARAASGTSGASRASAGSGQARTAHQPEEPVKELTGGLRVLVHVVLGVLGLLVAFAGVLLQAAWFPGGLLLALLGAAGLFYGGARGLRARSGAVTPAAAWLLGVLFLSRSRPEGDLLFGTMASSYLYLLGGMAVAVICATFGAPSQPGGLAARLAK